MRLAHTGHRINNLALLLRSARQEARNLLATATHLGDQGPRHGGKGKSPPQLDIKEPQYNLAECHRPLGGTHAKRPQIEERQKPLASSPRPPSGVLDRGVPIADGHWPARDDGGASRGGPITASSPDVRPLTIPFLIKEWASRLRLLASPAAGGDGRWPNPVLARPVPGGRPQRT